jgi:two-component system, response regulator PdtaR
MVMKHLAQIVERRSPTAGAKATLRHSRKPVFRVRTPPVAMGMMSASQNDPALSPGPLNSQASRRLTTTSGRPLRVVVVEDEAVIAVDIEMMLRDLGAEVIGVAMTAGEAIRLAVLHRPDCATMDINIKGDRDGVSAAIEIYETLGIRSIFVSAYGNDEMRARAAPANPFGWVKKPLDLEDLRSAFNRVLVED